MASSALCPRCHWLAARSKGSTSEQATTLLDLGSYPPYPSFKYVTPQVGLRRSSTAELAWPAFLTNPLAL